MYMVRDFCFDYKNNSFNSRIKEVTKHLNFGKIPIIISKKALK